MHSICLDSTGMASNPDPLVECGNLAKEPFRHLSNRNCIVLSRKLIGVTFEYVLWADGSLFKRGLCHREVMVSGDDEGDDGIIFIANLEGDLRFGRGGKNLVLLQLWSINLIETVRYPCLLAGWLFPHVRQYNFGVYVIFFLFFLSCCFGYGVILCKYWQPCRSTANQRARQPRSKEEYEEDVKWYLIFRILFSQCLNKRG